VANTISGNNIVFSMGSIQGYTFYYALLHTSIGVAYSNLFQIEVIIKCIPSI